MAQEYDKIFRENVEEWITTVARRLLGIDPNTLEEIPDDLQYTIERKPDFLKRVNLPDPQADYILQIEFQSTDSYKMPKRLLVYYAFLYTEYGLEVIQYVIYIGKKNKPTMPTEVRHKNLQFRYELIDIQDVDYEMFINSDRVEDVVVAILCDFKEKSPEYIIDTILDRLRKLNNDELDLNKYVKQLEVLSKLRNLQDLFIKKATDMPITYDLETDIRYLQGIEQNKENGTERLVLQNILTDEQIAQAMEVPVEVVRRIRKDLSDNNGSQSN